jgi:hypothetical protein
VLELLSAANVSQPALACHAFGEPKSARDALSQRVRVNRYLHGTRKPAADEVLAMNRAAEKLVGVDGIEAVLDAVAVLAGHIDLDDQKTVDAAFVVLDHFDSRGVLVEDWEKRFFAVARTMPERDLRRLLVGVFLAAWRPLIDDVVGKVPRQSVRSRVFATLSKHGLGELVSEPSPSEAGEQSFRAFVRKELLSPPATSEARLAAEQRFMRAAWEFTSIVSGKSELQLVLNDVDLNKTRLRVRGLS